LVLQALLIFFDNTPVKKVLNAKGVIASNAHFLDEINIYAIIFYRQITQFEANDIVLVSSKSYNKSKQSVSAASSAF
jgi:hypothetical protein